MFLWGLCTWKWEILKKAKDHFATGARTAADPNLKSIAIMYLAKVEVFDHNYDQADKILDIGLKEDGENPELLYEKAVSNMKMGNSRQAIDCLSKILKDSRQMPKAKLDIVFFICNENKRRY